MSSTTPKSQIDKTVDNTFTRLTKTAKKRNLDVSITKKHLKKLLSKKTCDYTGEEFGVSKLERRSLERVNPKIGYVDSNVIVVKSLYNSLRSDQYTIEDSKKQIDKWESKKLSREIGISDMENKIRSTEKVIESLEEQIVNLNTKLVTYNTILKYEHDGLKTVISNIDNLTKILPHIERILNSRLSLLERTKLFFSKFLTKK